MAGSLWLGKTLTSQSREFGIRIPSIGETSLAGHKGAAWADAASPPRPPTPAHLEAKRGSLFIKVTLGKELAAFLALQAGPALPPPAPSANQGGTHRASAGKKRPSESYQLETRF